MIKKIAISISISMLAFGAEFQAKDYSSLTQKMPKIDKGLLDVHFRLYQGYVAEVNKLDALLAKEVDPFTYQCIKRRYGWEYDGMVLHELYFENLGGSDPISSKSKVYGAIVDQFGSFDAWIEKFKETCLLRGIGWTILYWNPTTGILRNIWIEEHSTGPLIGEKPLLVIDLWEHAFLCQFGTDRKKYVETILNYVDWNVVEDRMALDIVAPKKKSKQKQKSQEEDQTDKTGAF
jgi:Fe-Mn family superoxide dismutase